MFKRSIKKLQSMYKKKMFPFIVECGGAVLGFVNFLDFRKIMYKEEFQYKGSLWMCK